MKDKSLTIRLTSDVVNKFKAYADDNGMKQGDFFEKMLNQYISPKTVDGKLEILMYYENFFIEDREKQIREPRKIIIEGKYQFYPCAEKCVQKAELCRENIEKDFGIKHNLKGYVLNYNFGVIEDIGNERLILQEFISIADLSAIANKLDVNNCRVVSGFEEIRESVRRYGSANQLWQLRYHYAQEKSSNDEIETYF